MVYERTHTRKVAEMGGLMKSIPFISAIMFIAGLCSLGLPGLSGFPAEMTVFMGGWERQETIYRVATIAGCLSIVVTAVYILRAIGSTVMGPLPSEGYAHFKDAAWYEKTAALLLVLGIIVMGVAPMLLFRLVESGTANIISVFSVD